MPSCVARPCAVRAVLHRWQEAGGSGSKNVLKGVMKKVLARRHNDLRAQRLKNVKILKFSSEIENFKRATHQTAIFVGNSEGRD